MATHPIEKFYFTLIHGHMFILFFLTAQAFDNVPHKTFIITAITPESTLANVIDIRGN